jgi:cysteine desulfurase
MTIQIPSEPVYLDGFATMPLAPEARAAILAAFDSVGNAASPHSAGEAAAQRIADARVAVAELINAAPQEIIFTSGATESNNLALIGVAKAAAKTADQRRNIIVSAIEHKAVLEPARHLSSLGFQVIEAPVDHLGVVDLSALARLIDADTLLISNMAVNNETGLIQPIAEIAALARQAGALFHCDAAQAVGKIDCDVQAFDIDYLSISSHKLYGPMGVGALYCAAHALRPDPLTFGGGQQSGLRVGTEPVALIAGFGTAASVATRRMSIDATHGADLAARLLAGLTNRQVRYTLVGKDQPRIPGGGAIALDGIDADVVCTMLARTVQLSTGSACNAGQILTSHVLDAMGFSAHRAQSVLRFMVNRYLTHEHIDRAADEIAAAVHRSALATGDTRQ